MTDNLTTKNYLEWVNHIEGLHNHADLYIYGDEKYIFHPKWVGHFKGFMKHPISISSENMDVLVSEIVVLDSLEEIENYYGNYLYMVSQRRDGKIIMRYARSN